MLYCGYRICFGRNSIPQAATALQPPGILLCTVEIFATNAYAGEYI